MGQTFVTGAFFVLLITAVMSSNRMMNESVLSSYEGEALSLASDIARTVLNEAQRKEFDLNVDLSQYQPASDFTSPSSLGPAGSESFTPWPDVSPYKSTNKYNDFDDYNGYQRVVDAGNITGFVVKAEVYYISPSTLSKVTYRTYVKRMDVTVEHPQYLKNKVTFSTTKTL